MFPEKGYYSQTVSTIKNNKEINIADLRKEGYIDREKKGRRNKYKINTEMHLKHPLEEHKTMADLIRLIYNNQ